ncbi:anhydro-N-acetylmuramic acid kinase [Vibrio sp. RC27]
MNEPEYYIGVMSGTSLDGVDVALVECQQSSSRLITHYCHPMPDSLKQQVTKISTGQALSIKTFGELDHQLGQLFADAVLALLALPECTIEHTKIRAIGNHGQTVFHQPEGETPFTLQLGDANIIAARTGIETIADFRRKDMAFGGQGAPLVPAFHQTLFESNDSSLIVLNIGGIANISVFAPDGKVVGYDTGPGNGLIDSWCSHHTGDRFDCGGKWAQQGKVNPAFLSLMLSDPFFSKPAPKSTGREYFHLDWIVNQLSQSDEKMALQDVQRTLTELTISSIVAEVVSHQAGPSPQLLVCGGGVQNPLIMQQLKQQLPAWQVMTTSQLGIDADFMEAMAFAWLAYRRVHNLPSNLPLVTGASKAVSLGVIYPADNISDIDRN